MPHRSTRLIRAALAALLVLAGVAACTSGRSQNRLLHADHRPNIVYVLTDDLSTDLVRYMPHVQALAEAGATFSNFYVVDSLCCPSRASIFTGQYPHNTHVFRNSGANGGYQGFDKFGNASHTFGVTLHKAGYRTAFLGKYLNLYDPLNDQPAKGWDEWDVTGTEGYSEYKYHLNENGLVHAYGSSTGDYLTDVLSKRAVQFVDKSVHSGQPFAMEVASFAPHQPAVPARQDLHSFDALHAPRGTDFNRAPTAAPSWLAHLPSLTAKDDLRIDDLYRKRVESVQAVDRMIGNLEQALLAKGELRNTYFVFSSDNGFHMGQYRLLPGKQTAFDTDIRVPLVVTGPGIEAGRTITDLASSIDLAPTFEAIAGARPSYVQDGSSLLGLLHGQPAPASWPRAVLVEHRGPNYQPNDPDRQVSRSANPPSYEAMRTGDALYVEYATGEREYYDLTRDPLELNNLAGRLPPATLAQLHRTLLTLEHCAGATCRQAAAAA